MTVLSEIAATAGERSREFRSLRPSMRVEKSRALSELIATSVKRNIDRGSSSLKILSANNFDTIYWTEEGERNRKKYIIFS